jgi:hypothetical protein
VLETATDAQKRPHQAGLSSSSCAHESRHYPQRPNAAGALGNPSDTTAPLLAAGSRAERMRNRFDVLGDRLLEERGLYGAPLMAASA